MNSSFRFLLIPVAVLASAFVLSACGGEVSVGDDTISASELETQTSKALTEETGQEPASVTCDGDVKAEEGETGTCEIEDPMGNLYDGTITITSVDDEGNAKFNVSVGDIKN